MGVFKHQCGATAQCDPCLSTFIPGLSTKPLLVVKRLEAKASQTQMANEAPVSKREDDLLLGHTSWGWRWRLPSRLPTVWGMLLPNTSCRAPPLGGTGEILWPVSARRSGLDDPFWPWNGKLQTSGATVQLKSCQLKHFADHAPVPLPLQVPMPPTGPSFTGKAQNK